MNDQDKSIMELMSDMKRDSDEFFGKAHKPSFTVGVSGRAEWNETAQEEADRHREWLEDEAMLESWEEIVAKQKAERAKQGFPDQGHKVRGGFKESDGSITVEVKPQTEWDEKS